MGRRMAGRWGLFRRGFFLVSIALLLSTGCARQVRPTEEAIKKDASLEELLNLYQIRREALPPFKGLLQVTAHTPREGRHTFQAAWSSQKHETRIQGFDLLGRTLFDLHLAGPALSLSIPSERKTFQGSRDEFERMHQGELPPLPVELLDWVRRAGIPEIPLRVIPAFEKGEDSFILYFFTMTDDGRLTLEKKIWIERTAFWVKRVESFDPSGARRALFTFDHYQKVGGFDFPFAIEGEGLGNKVALDFREVSPIRPPTTPS